jgi:hypothetical protein
VSLCVLCVVSLVNTQAFYCYFLLRLAFLTDNRCRDSSPSVLTQGHSGSTNQRSGSLATSVELTELVRIKLGALEHLDLAHKDVLHGVDALAFALDLLTHAVADQLGHQVLQIPATSLTLHHIKHLPADALNLRGLGIACLGELVLHAAGEANAEQAQLVTVGGLDIQVSLDQGLPLANH